MAWLSRLVWDNPHSPFQSRQTHGSLLPRTLRCVRVMSIRARKPGFGALRRVAWAVQADQGFH